MGCEGSAEAKYCIFFYHSMLPMRPCEMYMQKKEKKKEKEPQAFYTFWEKCSNMCDLWFSHVGGNLLISKHNLELNLYM